MRIRKLITMLAAAVCALAVSNAGAQTNLVTLTLTTYQQGSSNFVNTAHGTNTVIAGPSVKTYSNSKFIQEVLGPDTGHNNFSSAAKLTQTSVDDLTIWQVVDGTNVVDVTSVFNTSIASESAILSGTQSTNFLAAPKETGLALLTLQYNDGHVQFSVTGLAIATTMDTTPNNAGVYTETLKNSVTEMVGEGTSASGPLANGSFIATVKLSGSGKAQQSLF